MVNDVVVDFDGFEDEPLLATQLDLTLLLKSPDNKCKDTDMLPCFPGHATCYNKTDRCNYDWMKIARFASVEMVDIFMFWNRLWQCV